MEPYHKRKKLLEEKYGKLTTLKSYNDDVGIADTKQQKFVKQLQDISDEEGLKRAYDTRDGLYQHYDKLFIAGTKDFPTDHLDDLKLQFDDTLNLTKRGGDADAYYRSHHEIDALITHSLGSSAGLALQQKSKKESCNNAYGIVQTKSFGAPVVAGNISNPLLENIVKDEIVAGGVAGGLAIGTTVDSATGFSDGGLLSGLGADICKKVSTDFANRITSDTDTSPDRIKYFGDPVSMFDFNATTVMPSSKQRWNNSAHPYSGLFIKDAVPLHDTMKNPLPPSPDDSKAEVITSLIN